MFLSYERPFPQVWPVMEPVATVYTPTQRYAHIVENIPTHKERLRSSCNWGRWMDYSDLLSFHPNAPSVLESVWCPDSALLVAAACFCSRAFLVARRSAGATAETCLHFDVHTNGKAQVVLQLLQTHGVF